MGSNFIAPHFYNLPLERTV